MKNASNQISNTIFIEDSLYCKYIKASRKNQTFDLTFAFVQTYCYIKLKEVYMRLNIEQKQYIENLYEQGIRSEWRMTLMDKHILEQMNNYPNIMNDVGSYLLDIGQERSTVVKTDIPWYHLL
jgi:hypothetical protein